jgi:hypothetical protein
MLFTPASPGFDLSPVSAGAAAAVTARRLHLRVPHAIPLWWHVTSPSLVTEILCMCPPLFTNMSTLYMIILNFVPCELQQHTPRMGLANPS